MNLQIIKSATGHPEYVLLPISVYKILRTQIEKALKHKQDDYAPFDAADYVDNPVALARIKAHLSQQQLAERMGVTQAYISKLEGQKSVSVKVVEKVKKALCLLRQEGLL